MPSKLSGKVEVLTGLSKGFGAGIAHAPLRTIVIVFCIATACLVACSAGGGAQDANASAASKAFLDENAAAMKKMMTDMDVKPTGDVDRDFVAMMVPHHQGAIDMAQSLLKYGKNEQLRRLAQEIIITQQQEIAVMRLAVGQPSPTSPPGKTTAPATQLVLPHQHTH
jgi:hypothetical protein